MTEIWQDRFLKRTYEKARELAARANIKNYRLHPDQQKAIVEGSLDALGWVGSVKAAQGPDKIFDGHLRVKLALLRGGPDSLVPVDWYDLDEAETDRALLMHDTTTGLAGTDWEALTSLIDSVPPLDLPEYDEWIAGLLEEAGTALLGVGNGSPKDVAPKIDQAAELQKKWGTALGQVWQLGEHHRIACIDSTNREAVKKFLGQLRYLTMVTDPPYGVNYEGGRNPAQAPREKLQGDTDPTLYDRFLKVWREYRESKGVLYIWFADRGGKPVYDAVKGNGFDVRALIIWNKLDAHYGNFMAQYMQKHEPCLYCVKDGTNWYGPTNEVTVWDIKQPNVNQYHPTEKPLECMARPIVNSTKKGDLVVDPFLGSGTTLIACEQLGRVCYGAEIDPGYLAVTIQRWADLTGRDPIRLSE